MLLQEEIDEWGSWFVSGTGVLKGEQSVTVDLLSELCKSGNPIIEYALERAAVADQHGPDQKLFVCTDNSLTWPLH